MMKLRKASRRAAGKTGRGKRWIAALTAVVLTVGMVPAPAFAGGEFGAGGFVAVQDIVQRNACVVPSTTANERPKVIEWVSTTWLDTMWGLSPSLANRTPSEVLRCLFGSEDDFRPAVDGTASNPEGVDGSLAFVVQYPQREELVAKKTCTIKAKRWDPLVVEGGTEGDAYDYDRTAGVLTLKKEGSYVVSMGAGASTTDHRIVVAADATVTLKGVGIATDGEGAPPLDVEGHDVTLVLSGENSMVSNSYGAPGIRKGTVGALTIKGDGSVTARGGMLAAGIGGGEDEPAAGISIEGGRVTAVGGDANSMFNYGAAAGIGGGAGGAGTSISVGGGTVDAAGGKDVAHEFGGAGIGSGGLGYNAGVTIYGGSIMARGGEKAAGIGSGNDGGSGSVSISGGTVRAQGGSEGASGIGINAGGTASNFSINISGGSIDATMAPTPRGDADGDGPLASFKLKRVDYDVAPGTAITHANLTHPVPVPTYYGLTDVVPDDDGQIHLWLDERTGLKTSGEDPDGNPFEVTFVPGEGTTLSSDTDLTAVPFQPSPQQTGEVIGTAPGFGDAQLGDVPGVALTTTTLHEPAKLVSDPTKPEGEDYFIGDVIARGEGDAAQTFVVSAVSPYVPAAGDDPERSAFLNAVDVKTGWTSRVTEGQGGLAFADPVRVPNVPLNEASGFVKVDGALYALTWEAFAGTAGYDEYSWHYLSTVDGKPAGYYHVEKPEGKDAVVSGHFNVGCDPASVGASGDGFVVPVEGQVETPDGSSWAAFFASSLNLSLTGVPAGQGPLGTLEVDQEAAALDRLMGSLGLKGAAERGGVVFASGHFSPQRGLETAVSCEVVATADGTSVRSVYSVCDTSPFVTVALVKAPSVPVKQVVEASAPQPPAPSGKDPVAKPLAATDAPAAKPLASTGDGSAAAAATLAALALAAAAALALARRRAN